MFLSAGEISPLHSTLSPNELSFIATPASTSVSAKASTLGSSGIAEAWNRSRKPLPCAISCAWPRKPYPVMSVAEWTPQASIASEAAQAFEELNEGVLDHVVGVGDDGRGVGCR